MPVTHQIARHHGDRLLRCRQANALQHLTATTAHQMIEALHRQGQMRAPLVAEHGMDLVDDQRTDCRQHFAAADAGQQQIERFRRRHQNMRRVARHFLPLIGRGVAGAYGHADIHRRHGCQMQMLGYAVQRHFEILLDVITQSLEG